MTKPSSKSKSSSKPKSSQAVAAEVVAKPATKAPTKVVAKPAAKPVAKATMGANKAKQGSTVKMNYGGKEVEVFLHSKFDMTGFDKETIVKWYKLNHLGRKLDEKAALYLKMA